MKDDLEKYIARRKRRDARFARNFECGYEKLKRCIIAAHQRAEKRQRVNENPLRKPGVIARLRMRWEDSRVKKSFGRGFEMNFPTKRIESVQSEEFFQIVQGLRLEGWRKILEYDNMDAWVDYGMVVLKRDGELLKCEWTNWDEGSFEGSVQTVEKLREKFL